MKRGLWRVGDVKLINGVEWRVISRRGGWYTVMSFKGHQMEYHERGK